MQRNCGAVLSLQGERTGDTASLREAVDHYRAALEEYTRQESPIDVAVTQSNLGQALRVLGERDKRSRHAGRGGRPHAAPRSLSIRARRRRWNGRWPAPTWPTR